jgi:ParB family chromosome partitioning protein
MVTTDTIVPIQQLYEHSRLYEVPLADLQPDPNQPRKYLDLVTLDELTESIKQQGVVAPILFRMENGIAYVIAGERRCISARRAGLTVVEEAEALERLRKSRGYKQEELAGIIGKAISSISKTLSINRIEQSR